MANTVEDSCQWQGQWCNAAMRRKMRQQECTAQSSTQWRKGADYPRGLTRVRSHVHAVGYKKEHQKGARRLMQS